MRVLISAVCLAMTIGTAVAADDKVAACKTRQTDLAAKAAQYNGDSMIKRLIQADLDRATRELLEGDAEECTEALDHATKLLAGDI